MTPLQTIDQATDRKNLRILVHLRSLAFCVQIAAILTVAYGLNIVLPVAPMIGVAALLVAFNLYSFYRLRSARPVTVTDLFSGLVVDVAVLTLQLNFSGGTANPFVSFYMLPVIIGAVMLSAGYAWSVYGLTLMGYVALAVISFNKPMPGMEMPGLVDRFNLHMHGMMLGYAVSAGVLVFVINRIRSNLKARDVELEAAKARAAEEDHLVRMGLLSAGAAHELGTPLTTLSVLLKDLVDMPLPRKKADLLPDLTTMRAQVERCKAIVSGMLTASGDARAEDAKALPLKAFIAGAVEAWRLAHPGVALDARIDLPDTLVVADRIIEQVVRNLLDNAAEADGKAGSIVLLAAVEHQTLSLSVADRGAGFTPDVLARIGQPFVTTKNKTLDGQQRGLGLFLVSNVVRKLGGGLSVGNDFGADKAVTGARVQLTLPLTAISVEG